jgi:hypothetical protein
MKLLDHRKAIIASVIPPLVATSNVNGSAQPCDTEEAALAMVLLEFLRVPSQVTDEMNLTH